MTAQVYPYALWVAGVWRDAITLEQAIAEVRAAMASCRPEPHCLKWQPSAHAYCPSGPPPRVKFSFPRRGVGGAAFQNKPAETHERSSKEQG